MDYCIKQPNAYLVWLEINVKFELTKKLFEEGKLAAKKELETVEMPMGININNEGLE